ncbi:hypothetical protein [Roseibaca sp. Y0-43]|uniref:hypothetical protein n=1 Tax=Roseibaca sp. Y0-43 TaxID=2816854 RepID=UPI001D0C26E5|nr:hypothetical protein [Roseibaca sp. Y0-43]MCC1480308.1 hypothetical protein [Roseibaca sp. Y0-43]
MNGLVKSLALAVFALLLAAQSALASDRITPEMVSQALEGQGYTVESVTRTLLGRVRVVASMGGIWREIVLDASTGQILRDYAVEFSPGEMPNPDPGDMPRGGDLLENPDLLTQQN